MGKRLVARDRRPQDMACLQKVVARVSGPQSWTTVHGLKANARQKMVLRVLRTMVIMAQSPFWAMVGHVGIADHQWSSWAERQKPWSSWATGSELPSPWAKRVGRMCNQWQEGHFGHKGMVTWVGSFIWRWQWHGQQVLGKFNWASLI